MKAKHLLIASFLTFAAVGAHADTGGVTRAQVQQELRDDFEIRQQLMLQREVAMRAGCDFNAVSYDADASIACNSLVQKIAAMKDRDAASKVASYKEQSR